MDRALQRGEGVMQRSGGSMRKKKRASEDGSGCQRGEEDSRATISN
jgi:hypothetical protein